MENPYEAPASPASSARPRSRRWDPHALASLLIAAFCTLQFWGILFPLIGGWQSLDFGGLTPYSALGGYVVLPGTLFVAGILLAFRRKASALLFALYVVGYLVYIVPLGKLHLATLLLALAMSAYSAYLFKRGWLGGGPARSAKVTPRGGAA